MDYDKIMRKYIKVEVPLDEMEKLVDVRVKEIETISGQEDNTAKQLNIYKMVYFFLTIIMIIVLILSVNFKLK
tara:strand:+ start:8519 stop:8737 length:219 start_codon:yes stop_codon:yes gene_type:complete